MDRGALLLYLRNVRDLEVAKYRINVQYNREKRDVEGQINNLEAVNYEHVTYSPMLDPPGAIIVVVILFLIVGVPLLFLGFFHSSRFLIFLSIPFLFVSVGFLCILIVDKIKYNKACNKAKNHNTAEDERLQNNKPAVARLTTDWKNKERWYNGEYNKVQQLLADFYGMNILPSQYRNLAAVCYIYDYMSSSQASLEDTLIHEHMENGIQRLEAKLDSIIVRLEDIVYETRCIRQNSERTIEQNNNMLTSLRQTERNTMEAAQYAQLSANYSRANAYFSLATYLKD